MRRLLLIAALLLAVTDGFAVARADGPERFVVFFGSWSARIDTPAHKSLVAAALAAKQHAEATISVTGYASTVGTVAANKLLSQLRAQVVADELVAAGVDVGRITMTATEPTNFVLDPLEARRVVVVVGGK